MSYEKQVLAALQLVIADFDNRPTHSVTGKGGNVFAFFPTSITDNIPPLHPELSEAVQLLSGLHLNHLPHATLGVGEEDRGAMIISDILLHHRLPRTLARWTPTGAPGEVAIPLVNEYIQEGEQVKIFLNGVRPDDRILLIDDLISTGGTMVALIQAVKKTGAEILEVFTIGEKAENQGRQFVLQETGLHLKTLLVTDMERRSEGLFSRVVRCHLGNLDPDAFGYVASHFPEGFCQLGSGESKR